MVLSTWSGGETKTHSYLLALLLISIKTVRKDDYTTEES